MATPSTKKRPPLEMEPGEGKAHEMAETPEEEKNEGPEPDDGPKAKSRKRSPKGAKNTKAPMDAEACCSNCAEGKPCKGKAMKDGGCGSSMKDCATCTKRNDSLTPQEYLAACELGIQNRHRCYIRARLDVAERLDLKCGNGSISEGEKCTKGATRGPATSKKRPSVRGALENAAIIGGTAGTLFSYGQLLGHASKGNLAGASKALQREGAFAALGGAGYAAKGARTNNKEMQKAGKNALATGALAIGAGHFMGGGYTKGLGGQLPSGSDLLRRARAGSKRAASNVAGASSALRGRVSQGKARRAMERAFKKPGKRGDSIWATGFSPESGEE